MFHYLTRAIIIQNDSVLLVREKGATEYFLPGGHIEFNEPAKTALKRELKEETNLDIEVGRFYGSIENHWLHNGEQQQEINLVFEVNFCSGFQATVDSCEEHLEFLWVEIAQLASLTLHPTSVSDLIQNRDNIISFWGSGYA